MRKGMKIFLRIGIVIEIFFLILCIVNIIFGQEDRIVWLVFLLAELFIGIPDTLRIIKRYDSVESNDNIHNDTQSSDNAKDGQA